VQARYDPGMFAMMLGGWPRVTADGVHVAELESAAAAGRASSAAQLADVLDRLTAEAVAAQVGAGMGLVTDGNVRWSDPGEALLHALRTGDTGAAGLLVRAWRAAAALTDVPVAQAVPGPWTLAARSAGPGATPVAMNALAGDVAEKLAAELAALAAAGCPVIVVAEPGVPGVEAGPLAGADARTAFLEAHRALLRGIPDVHAMLEVAGGSAWLAGPEAVFGAPYRSHAFNLVAGPDNWHLVRAAPADRGIVCAALVAGHGAEDADQAPQLVWAAHYAASAGPRGLDRVGLANASSLAGLDPAAARRALDALGRAAVLAGMPLDEAIRAGLDPRTINTLPGPGRGPV
jgi:hypothetical protein